jgi:hypothetical protein
MNCGRIDDGPIDLSSGASVPVILTAQIWADSIGWHYDARDGRPPRQRATGTVDSIASAVASVTDALRHFASESTATIQKRT